MSAFKLKNNKELFNITLVLILAFSCSAISFSLHLVDDVRKMFIYNKNFSFLEFSIDFVFLFITSFTKFVNLKKGSYRLLCGFKNGSRHLQRIEGLGERPGRHGLRGAEEEAHRGLLLELL